jgi:general secretion pathway protein J
MAPTQRNRGFTLIELLVAIGIMALMAGLSWRGLDGMARTQERLRQRADQVLTVQAGLSQWAADLDAMVQLPNTPALDWDGRALRITRRSTASSGDGLLVVAWARRTIDGTGQWLRWQSAPLQSRGALQTAWAQAAQWAQNPGEEDKKYEVRVAALDQWKVFYFRADAWSNPLSSDGAPAPAGAAKPTGPDLNLPEGVRLVVTLPADGAIAGTLTRDWVRITLGGGKS